MYPAGHEPVCLLQGPGGFVVGRWAAMSSTDLENAKQGMLVTPSSTPPGAEILETTLSILNLREHAGHGSCFPRRSLRRGMGRPGIRRELPARARAVYPQLRCALERSTPAASTHPDTFHCSPDCRGYASRVQVVGEDTLVGVDGARGPQPPAAASTIREAIVARNSQQVCILTQFKAI